MRIRSLPVLSRRRAMLTMAAAGAVAIIKPTIGSSAARAMSWQGSFDGLRYDAKSAALMLAGEPGTYVPRGVYVSEPFPVLTADSLVRWFPRWTAPLQWDRFVGNPVLVPRPDEWDATPVSTCSVVRLRDELRMFYGARDRGIGLAVSRGSDPHRWQRTDRPVFTAGSPGAFDAGGVLSPTVVPVSDSLWYMYYVGYDPERVVDGIKVHQIGLARSDDRGASWQRVDTRPVIALGPRGSVDGATISSNSVLKVGDRWFCWYTGMAQIPYLASICLATSSDGIHWEKHSHNPVLSHNPYIDTDAFMVATPHVLYEHGVFRMWFNSKGYGNGRSPGNYTIGYAESLDGIHWERCERRPMFGPSSAGWDSTMVEYPEVLNIDGAYHLWYCGDGYSSIGHARGRATTAVEIEVRTGADPHARWSAWSRLADPTGSKLATSAGYAQLRITLTSSDRHVTPMVQDLSVLEG